MAGVDAGGVVAVHALLLRILLNVSNRQITCVMLAAGRLGLLGR
jgi:hypothetical protein